jgi:hypothetical protein
MDSQSRQKELLILDMNEECLEEEETPLFIVVCSLNILELTYQKKLIYVIIVVMVNVLTQDICIGVQERKR